MLNQPRKLWMILTVTLLLAAPARSEIIFDFVISTDPAAIQPGQTFELVINFQGSASCTGLEDFVEEPTGLRVELSCECPSIPPGPSPIEWRLMASPLAAGSYPVEVVDVTGGGSRLLAQAQIVVGDAPAIPISPPALFILALILAAAAVWFLRR